MREEHYAIVPYKVPALGARTSMCLMKYELVLLGSGADHKQEMTFFLKNQSPCQTVYCSHFNHILQNAPLFSFSIIFKTHCDQITDCPQTEISI